MPANNTETHRYRITIKGEGGELSFIPMTREEVAYWRDRGNDALAEHLNGGWEDDGTPAAFKLGNFYDIGESAAGVELGVGADFTVEDEAGKVCFEKTVSDADLGDLVRTERNVVAPPTGAFFRTYEKGALTYELELAEPFDPSMVRLQAVETPEGELINGMTYAGEETLSESDLDRAWADNTAELVG
jgi:hypothetical protein